MGGVVLGIQGMGKLLCAVGRGWQIEVCGRKCEVSGRKEEEILRAVCIRG
jgi:hypothetical protein